MNGQSRLLPPLVAVVLFGLALVLGFNVSTPSLVSAATQGRSADFYVSPEGKDSWSGTLDAPNANKTDGPFASLDRARRAVRDTKKRNAPIVVALRGGTYFLSAPVNFDHSDSGTANAPVVYEAFNSEKPVISGGRVITGWKNTSGNAWTTDLSSRDFTNFEALFFNDERRYRPRTTEDKYLYIDRPVIMPEREQNCSQPPNQELSSPPAGRRQGGGGPGGGGGYPGGGGGFPGGGFPGRRFPFPGGPGGGRRGQGRGPGGGQNSENGFICFDRFRYKGDDIQSHYHGMELGDVEILDFEKWTMSPLRLKEVDTSQHIVYMTGPTYPAPQVSGFFPNHRYLIQNVKEALKNPGQWYLDRCPDSNCSSPEGTWTLTYLAKRGEDPNRMQVIVPQVPQLIVAEELQYVTFKGLTFSHDNWLPAPEGLGDLQGGFKVPGALSFRRSSHIVFDGDVVAHTQGWGIDFFGASNDNQVVNSALYDIGYGAIRVGRMTKPQEDSDDSVPAGNLVDNDVIEGLGRVIPSGIGTGVWIGNSHNNKVTHNEIYDVYSGAIRIGYKLNIRNGKGNAHDNLAAYNLVYNLGQGVTSDMGGIYTSTSDTQGNQILNNVIHDVVHDPGPGGYGGNGLYCDQGSSNVLLKNNLVYRVSGAGYFQNFADIIDGDTPQNNVLTNNIFVYPKKHLLQRGGENRNSFTFSHNIVYYDQAKMQAEPGKWSCSNDCTDYFLLESNMYWNTKGGKPEFITTGRENPRRDINRHSFSEWQSMGEDKNSVIADPMFADPRPPQDDYTVRNTAAAREIGFVAFDPKEAGRSHPVLKAPPVPPAFPLQLLDPNDF